MRDERGEDDWVDALLSAGLDDALSAEEQAEFDGLLGQDAAGARAEAFEEVDAALRSLAEEPVDDARIAASLETLRERLDWAEEAPRRFPVAFPVALSVGLPLGLAAAAAAMAKEFTKRCENRVEHSLLLLPYMGHLMDK